MTNLLAIAEEKAAVNFSTGLEETAKAAYGAAPQATVEIVVGKTIETVLAIVGLLFLVLTIYGGVSWMLAGRGGKEDDISKAKKILESAAVGLVIVAAGYAITKFVVDNLYKATR